MVLSTRVDSFVRAGIFLMICPLSLACSMLFSCPPDVELDSAYRMVFSGNLGYTLIGVKPVSVDELQCRYLKTHPKVFDRFIKSLEDIFIDCDDFIFKAFKFDDGSYEIELINKKSLKELISKNFSVVKFISENFSDEKAFYASIGNPNISIFRVINNEFIMGILFGYGEENAHHFCRICGIGDHLKKIPFVTLFDTFREEGIIPRNFPGTIDFPYVGKVPALGIGFNSLEAEWDWLQSVDLGITKGSKTVPPYFIKLPTYLRRKSPESDEINATYIRAREKLAHLFNGKSCRQAVIDAVCSV